MRKNEPHPWEFKARFRRHAFGWKSQPAIQRIKQAVARDQEGRDARTPCSPPRAPCAFLERLSPALEHVDSSSGAIGTAVNNAIAELVADHRERARRREDARRLARAAVGGARGGRDPLHRAARRPLGRALRLEGGRLGVGRPPARHHAHGAQPRPEPARPLPRDVRLPERALPRRALRRDRRPARRVDTIWPYKRWAVKALAAMGEKCRGHPATPSRAEGRRRRDGDVDARLRGDPPLLRARRRGLRGATGSRANRGGHLPRDLPRRREEVPAQDRAARSSPTS